MEILENCSNNILKIIEQKAKYQKVMVLYGEETSNVELNEIYNLIKKICVYNQQSIYEVNIKEIYNGYRAIIYLCSPEEFVKLNFCKREFVNLVILKDKVLMPYCVDVDNKIIKKDLFLFGECNCVDVNMLSSLSFNKAFNNIENILQVKVKSQFQNINKNLEIIDNLKNIDDDFEFVDIDILRQTNIKYCLLNILHLILIDAFILMLSSVKFKSISLIDTYKICKDDYIQIDKFYKMYCNENFFTILTLNYNYLYNLCVQTKQEILDNFITCQIEEVEIENIFQELKNYSKNTNNFISYLYLFDFFKI